MDIFYGILLILILCLILSILFYAIKKTFKKPELVRKQNLPEEQHETKVFDIGYTYVKITFTNGKVMMKKIYGYVNFDGYVTDSKTCAQDYINFDCRPTITVIVNDNKCPSFSMTGTVEQMEILSTYPYEAECTVIRR